MRTLVELVSSFAARGDAPAIVNVVDEGTEVLSFRDLGELADRIAGGLA